VIATASRPTAIGVNPTPGIRKAGRNRSNAATITSEVRTKTVANVSNTTDFGPPACLLPNGLSPTPIRWEPEDRQVPRMKVVVAGFEPFSPAATAKMPATRLVRPKMRLPDPTKRMLGRRSFRYALAARYETNIELAVMKMIVRIR